MSKIDIPYDEITDALKRIGVEMDAAEVHGVLCGLFCTIGGLTPEYWFDQSLNETSAAESMSIDALSNESRSLLTELFNATNAQLNGEDFSFEPFLPPDEAGIFARVEAVGHWCQGYLLGLSQGGLTDPAGLPGDLPEIVQDMIEISRADSYELDDDMDNEKDLMQLVEFIRVGVQLFMDEMHKYQAEKPSDDSAYH